MRSLVIAWVFQGTVIATGTLAFARFLLAAFAPFLTKPLMYALYRHRADHSLKR